MKYLIKDRPKTPRSQVKIKTHPVYRVIRSCDCLFADGRRTVSVEKGTLLTLLGCDLIPKDGSYFMYDGFPIMVPNSVVEHVWGRVGPTVTKSKA